MGKKEWGREKIHIWIVSHSILGFGVVAGLWVW